MAGISKINAIAIQRKCGCIQASMVITADTKDSEVINFIDHNQLEEGTFREIKPGDAWPDLYCSEHEKK